MNKNFDCVKLKNDLQEKLYNKYMPKDIYDYFEKMKKSLKTNILYKEYKKQSENNLVMK